MDRRKFLGLASFAGLSVASLDALARPGARRQPPRALIVKNRGPW